MCRMEQELHTETETKCHDGEWVSIPKQEPFQTPPPPRPLDRRTISARSHPLSPCSRKIKLPGIDLMGSPQGRAFRPQPGEGQVEADSLGIQ